MTNVMIRKKLTEAFPDWVTDGIFNALQQLDVPWNGEVTGATLDLEYFGNVSGDKWVSPLVRKLGDPDTGELSSANITLLAGSAYSINHLTWEKEWATLEAQYNPIQNYDMREQMLSDTTVIDYGKIQTRTDDLTHAKTGSDTQTPDLTTTRTLDLSHGRTGTITVTPDTLETTTPNLTTATSNAVHGFNSATGAPASSTVTQNSGVSSIALSGTEVTDHNITETDSGTDTTTQTGTNEIVYDTTETDTGDVTTEDSGKDTHTRNYTLTRSGNIGVTTSQQMLESERELWRWNYFREIVFPDLDKILALQIY